MRILKLIMLFVFGLFDKLTGAEIYDMEDGSRSSSSEEVTMLLKALEAQEGVTDVSNLTGGGALQPQSLEQQLALLTFQQDQFKFYKKIGKVKAYSTLEEYTVQQGYGAEGGFVGQLENPEEDDPEYARKFAVIKYIRTLWRVSHVLKYSKTISSAEIAAVQSAMMRALRITESNLFWGNSEVLPSSFDGIEKAILENGSSAHVIDLRGATITEANMKLGAEIIAANFGRPTEMYTSLSVQNTIDNILGPNQQRLNQDRISGNGAITLGHHAPEMITSYGKFSFEPDLFINPEAQGVPSKNGVEGATSTKAPATPTLAAVANAPTVTGSKWKTTGDGGAIAGAYNYRVSAINKYGKSAASTAASATVAANGAVTLTITAGAGAYPATGYEIYRETAPGSGKIYLLKVIKSDGATTTYQDKNDDLSGTSKSFLLDNTTVGESRTIALAELAPMHKTFYAIIGPFDWGTVNYYATPKFYAPLKYVMFKNVGVASQVKSPVIDL